MALCRRHGLPAAAADRFLLLLDALAAEADPPTTAADPEAALAAHVADSLTGLELAALREAETIADLGSGAGFPGLVLAVAHPGAGVDLIESVARKCAVIERLAAAAGATNARAIAVRAEDWARGEGRERYAAVTARAVAPLGVLCEYGAPLLVHGGTLVCWKGARGEREERAGARAAAALGLLPLEPVRVAPFPGAHSRHLHAFEKQEATPARFPRRAGMAAKRPLAN